MACACKSKSAGQVTAVKQVVKKVASTRATVKATPKRTAVRHIVYKRPI